MSKFEKGIIKGLILWTIGNLLWTTLLMTMPRKTTIILEAERTSWYNEDENGDMHRVECYYDEGLERWVCGIDWSNDTE